MSDSHPRPLDSAHPVASGDEPALPRRRFLALVTGTLACRELRAATDRGVDAGRIEDYSRDVISEKFAQYDLFVIRHQGRLFACTAICPHQANFLLLAPNQAGRIVCSGHESTFDLAGINRSGPARRALDRFAISVNSAGRVMVDTSRTFRQPRWNDPASFVAIQ